MEILGTICGQFQNFSNVPNISLHMQWTHGYMTETLPIRRKRLTNQWSGALPGSFCVICTQFDGSVTGQDYLYKGRGVYPVWREKILTLQRDVDQL